jgi:thiol-disulfide isomerase/thioredoxin
MKKLFLICTIAALLAACSSQPESGYTVNVNVTGDLAQLPNDTLIFKGGTDKHPVIDTAVLVNGKCTIKGKTNTPTFYDLNFKGEKKMGFTSIFLENARVDVTFDAAEPFNATITGGGECQVMVTQMRAKVKEVAEQYKLDSLRKAMNLATATEEEKQKVTDIYKKISAEGSKINDAFISANPTSPYSLYELRWKIRNMSYAEIEAALVTFDTIPAYAENVMLKEYKEYAALVKSSQTGNPAPDFVQNNPDGEPVKFSDIYSKNKLTMLDFWASWCRPCRAFNPELVKIYKKYHNKGFEILGVSLDNSHDAWIKGIKEDKLTWPQVSDLKEWENEAGCMYNVNSVPHNVFVDQNGIIVGRGIGKKEVAAFIEEFLNK